MESNSFSGSKGIQKLTLGSLPQDTKKDKNKTASTLTHSVKPKKNSKPKHPQQSEIEAGEGEGAGAGAASPPQRTRSVSLIPEDLRQKRYSQLIDCSIKTCEISLESYYKKNSDIYESFLSVDSPDRFTGSSAQICKILPLCTGICIDLVLEKMSASDASDPVDLTRRVFNNQALIAQFRSLFVFANAKNPCKPYGMELFKNLEKGSWSLFLQIANGILEHRNILPSLQEALDSNPLTKGFPAHHFVMLFGSENDCLLGPDAHNFGPYTMHGIATGLKALLDSLAGDDIPRPDLAVLTQLRGSFESNVRTEFGQPIEPANKFAVGHAYHTPRAKFSEDGKRELLNINVKCDQGYAIENRVFYIRGIYMVNTDYPDKVTITAYSGDRKLQLINEAFKEYNLSIRQAGRNDGHKRVAIALLIKKLLMLHYFLDGNGRSCILLMTRELLRNGMRPSIILDADSITAKSSKELAQIIEQGQQRFVSIIENQNPLFLDPNHETFYKTTYHRIRQYFESHWEENMPYTDMDELD